MNSNTKKWILSFAIAIGIILCTMLFLGLIALIISKVGLELSLGVMSIVVVIIAVAIFVKSTLDSIERNKNA